MKLMVAMNSATSSLTRPPSHSPSTIQKGSAMKSPYKSMPINIQQVERSASEMQLLEDEHVADIRDFNMYARIVNGIAGQGSVSHQDSLRSIIRTRHQPLDENDSYSHGSTPSSVSSLDYYDVFYPETPTEVLHHSSQRMQEMHLSETIRDDVAVDDDTPPVVEDVAADEEDIFAMDL